MLIYETLKRDHELMRDILHRMEESSEGAIHRRHDLLERLHDELIPHSRAEEKVLYDTLKEIDGTHELTLEFYEEHSTAESVLRELRNINPSDERWLAKLGVLKETLDHHIDEEETRLFAMARQVLAPEEAEMMAEAFRHLKKEVKNGSLLQGALEAVASSMPARFARRFTDLSRRLT